MIQERHVPVPLPTEVPPPPNLSQLPAHILHSGTVETLIGQNEDLMARLKVNIRRNSVLEQQLMEHDRVNQEITHAYNSLVAQIQVLQEKDEMWKEKEQNVDAQANDLRDRIDFLSARVEAAEERRDELQAGLRFEKAYRRRVRAWVRPFIDGLQHQLETAETKSAFLERQLATREAAIGDLRARLETATAQMQNLARKSSQDQALLVEKYEARLKTADADAAKAARIDQAIAQQTSAENRIVFLERRNQEMEQALGGEMKQVQDQVAGFRMEAKTLAAEVMTAHQERDAFKAKAEEAEAEKARIQDQFESLQAVWAEAQKKFEASKLQQDSLNKLNQELSRQLRADRKARGESDLSVGPTAAIAAPLKDQAREINPENTQKTAQSLDRIDSLLAALEAGFTKARGSDSQINGLEIVESAQAPQTRDSEASL